MQFEYYFPLVPFDEASTGTYTDIRPGMTVLFGSSAGDEKPKKKPGLFVLILAVTLVIAGWIYRGWKFLFGY